MIDAPHAEVGDEYDLIDVPPVEDYKRALKGCRDAGLFKGDNIINLKMLEANYRAKDHTLTAGELAESVNLAGVVVANGHYGRFARKLCEQLDRDPESRATRAGKQLIWMAILVRFSGGKAGTRRSEDESIRWTLLPELVTALEETFFSHLKPQR